MLSGLKSMPDPNILVGFDGKDDAAVYKVRDDLCIVHTMDFFPPVVDDPYDYGRIAAANAISDIYAMGATPLMALNILTFPGCLAPWVVKEILRGGNDKALEAGMNILGGHTIEDTEPKYGLSVIGIVHPDELLSNAGAQVGDQLILTKKIGTGIIATAVKADLVEPELEQEMNESMALLNKYALEIAKPHNIHSLTDVTGFGLVGHALEMAEGSEVSIKFYLDEIPYFDTAEEFASWGIIPAGAYHNRNFVGDKKVVEGEIIQAQEDLVFDPQTSGGLLIALSPEDAANALKDFEKAGHLAVIVGEVVPAEDEPKIILTTKGN